MAHSPAAFTDLSRAGPPAPVLFWAALPVLLLSAVLAGSIDDPHWLRASPLDAPPVPYDPTLLEPQCRDQVLRDPPRGIALGLYSMDPAFDYGLQLVEIAATGAPWVEMIVNHFQERHDSSLVGVADPRTAPWPRIEHTIAQAHALGLRVHLMPILLLRTPRPQDWRGTIEPIEVARWHRSYRTWIVEIARRAALSGVEALCVGSEFNSRQGDLAPWLETIARVREAYGGAITYSANWDSFDTVSFLDALDAVGLTTYYPLARHPDPSVEELIQAWLPVRAELRRWQRESGIPMLFTEVGYASIDGVAMHPWDYTAEGAVDLGEQRDCLEAFAAVWREVPELTGVFFFLWWGDGGDGDRGFTPRRKPALRVVERWFDPHDVHPNEGHR